MRTIYLLRHCETEHDLKKRCIGITDLPLNETGIRHAQRLKEYFMDKGLIRVFCSNAIRSIRTAEIISGGKIQITEFPALHEINMGDWDGMYFEDIKLKFPQEYRQRGLDFAAFAPPNGESFAVCQTRALTAFQNILENTHGNLAIVSHAGFNRTLLCSFCKTNLQEIFTIPQPFGCVNILSIQDGICHVEKIGFEIDKNDGYDDAQTGVIK